MPVVCITAQHVNPRVSNEGLYLALFQSISGNLIISHMSPFLIPIHKGRCPKIFASYKYIFNFILQTGTISVSMVLTKPAAKWKTKKPSEKCNLEKKNQSNNITGILSKLEQMKKHHLGEKCLKSLSSLRIFMPN